MAKRGTENGMIESSFVPCNLSKLVQEIVSNTTKRKDVAYNRDCTFNLTGYTYPSFKQYDALKKNK